MKYILLLLLFISPYLHAQDSAGLILPTKEFKSCCVYIPESGLTIYKEVNGLPEGKIYLGKADQQNEVYSALIKNKGVEKELDHANFESVGYETSALIFIDKKDNFVQLKNKFWLDITELTSQKLQLTPWLDYAIDKEVWYANDPGLNLRSGPSTDFSKMATLKGNLFQIVVTSETKGKWAKVLVEKFNAHPCSSADVFITETYTGWVKLVAEDGTLNVYNFSKGC